MRDAAIALAFAEVLLPGGAGFPSFGATQAGPLLLQRLGTDDTTRLVAAIEGRGTPDTPGGWMEAAARIEALEPGLFTVIRRQAYLAYYEQPAVIAAIRALGHPYNDAPLPHGYPAQPFDTAQDSPHHGRGRWVDTNDVRRVDVTALELESLR